MFSVKEYTNVMRMIDYWGHRCEEFNASCWTCKAWAKRDYLLAKTGKYIMPKELPPESVSPNMDTVDDDMPWYNDY